jgi:hypothetical protein
VAHGFVEEMPPGLAFVGSGFLTGLVGDVSLVLAEFVLPFTPEVAAVMMGVTLVGFFGIVIVHVNILWFNGVSINYIEFNIVELIILKVAEIVKGENVDD